MLGQNSQSKLSYPKVSVVTVTYNCVDLVESTLRNVLKQTYPNLEYIVIDGNSTDGTRQVVERYADRLAYCVSEPDNGIYDAMNKGIHAATGEWIIFMNAGDYFLQSTTVEDVFGSYDDKGEVMIAGGIRCFIKEGYFDRMPVPSITNNITPPHTHTRTLSQNNFIKEGLFVHTPKVFGDEIWNYNMFPHQAMFIRLSVHKKYLFPQNLKIVGDYCVFMKIMLSNAPYVIYNGIVALFRNEAGASTRNENFTKIWDERLMVMQMLGASENVIKEKKRQRNKMMVQRWVLAVMKLFPFIYKPYHLRMYIRQPLEETLKNV